MFTVEQRDRIRERVLELARSDARVVAAAELGSLALGPGDRWSDLDLGFGLAEGAAPTDVLDDWSETLERDDDAVELFDLPSGTALYRVFLFPGCLQVDLSCAPAADFGARAPSFRLLFGAAADVPALELPPARQLFGLGVHHAVRARVCIERRLVWQAQYWIAALRDEALGLPCLRNGLDPRWARGYDRLPPEVLDGVDETLVRSLERDELLRALARAVDLLLREADAVRELAARVEPELRDLASAR